MGYFTWQNFTTTGAISEIVNIAVLIIVIGSQILFQISRLLFWRFAFWSSHAKLMSKVWLGHYVDLLPILSYNLCSKLSVFYRPELSEESRLSWEIFKWLNNFRYHKDDMIKWIQMTDLFLLCKANHIRGINAASPIGFILCTKYSDIQWTSSLLNCDKRKAN